MLYEFLTSHRVRLVEDCRGKVAARVAPQATAAELEHGVPLFLDQLIAMLQMQHSETGQDGGADAPLRVGARMKVADDQIGASATRHGGDLMQQGFTVGQVVHDYGDLCQAVTELAVATGANITAAEFGTLNRCLDDAIASAVAEFSERHDSRIADDNLRVSDERARALLLELQGHVQAASFAIAAVKAGNVGLKGATGALLDLAMISMRTLIERSLVIANEHVGLRAHH